MARLREANSSGISVSGLWIQDWSGTKMTPFGKRVFWNWQWDQTHYPGMAHSGTTLHQRAHAHAHGTSVLTHARTRAVKNEILDLFNFIDLINELFNCDNDN